MSLSPTKPCRSPTCRAPIYWGTTITGKRIPLDPDPVPDGRYIISGQNAVPFVVHIAADDPTDQPRYNAHFVTCPERKQWQKPT